MKNAFFAKKTGSTFVQSIAVLLLNCLLVSCLSASWSVSKKFFTDPVSGVENEYFVHYQDGVSESRKSQVLALHNASIITDFSDFIGVQLVSVTENEASALSQNSDIQRVEQNSYAYLYQHIDPPFVQNDPEWGLDRIDQADLPLDGEYRYANNGSNVDIYIIDSGVFVDHPEFENRATEINDLFPDNECLEGHGTHVAGIASGKTFGVAKGARIFSVRVFASPLCDFGAPRGDGPPIDPNVQATVANVIEAIENIIQHKLSESPQRPAVVNMSFGFPGLSAGVTFRAALAALQDANIIAVAAAGNSAENACGILPGSSGVTINVGSTDLMNDMDLARPSSNQGACVDIFAPGQSIISSFYDYINDQATVVALSGTSMAAPFVTGVVAQILHENPGYSSQQVLVDLLSIAAENKLAELSLFEDSPNVMVQTLDARPPAPPPQEPVDDAQEDDDTFANSFAIDYDIVYDYNFAFDRYDWIEAPRFDSVVPVIPPSDPTTTSITLNGNKSSQDFGRSKFVEAVVFIEVLGSRLVGNSEICVDWYTHPENGDGSLVFNDTVCQGEVAGLSQTQIAIRLPAKESSFYNYFHQISGFVDNYLLIRPKVQSLGVIGLDTEYRVKMIDGNCEWGSVCPLPDPAW